MILLRYILLFLAVLCAPIVVAQNYTVQDMTLQLDENGEATLVPEDVLVNPSGYLLGMTGGKGEPIRKYHFDYNTQTLEFVSAGVENCVSEPYYFSHDLNPVNKKVYVSSKGIEGYGSFVSYNNSIDCEVDRGIGTVFPDNECGFGFTPPYLFSVDKDGILYATHSGISYAFNIYSNIWTQWAEFGLDPSDNGLTYDFDNHRLIATAITNNITLFAADIDTLEWEELFSINPIVSCQSAYAVEYIGSDTLIVGTTCNEIYAVNMVTQEKTLLGTEPTFFYNFLFLEDEIPDTTLSQTQFTCSDVGEQTVDITVLENGNPVNYQATVNVVPDFSVRGCSVYRRLTLTDPNGSDDARLDDYTDTIEIVSSCSSSFTVTQDPPPGTLIPHEETVDIILTVTDEFGNTTLCKTVGCSDSPLSIKDNELEKNIVVAPNPTIELITIENKNSISLSNIEVYDIHGRVLQNRTNALDGNTVSLSLATHSSGVFFVRINTEDGFLVKQIIKQ